MLIGGLRVNQMEAGTLGARLLRARLEYGSRLNPPRAVTQLEVAKALGVSGVAVGGWEADRNEPGLDYIRALARLYGVRVGWLVDGELPMRAGEGGQGAQNPAPPPKPANGPARVRAEVANIEDYGVDVVLPGKGGAKRPKRRPGDRTARAG
jgi:transcriptional regulator with XRE-family HTH domain